MTSIRYSNVPTDTARYQGTDATIQLLNNYYAEPLELKASEFDAIVGFFTSKGFDTNSAQSITVAIINQSKIDNFNPMIVLDTMKRLDKIELNNLILEILNYNRYKTSFLGYKAQFLPTEEVVRNIVP